MTGRKRFTKEKKEKNFHYKYSNVYTEKLRRNYTILTCKCKTGCSIQNPSCRSYSGSLQSWSTGFGENKVQEMVAKQPILPNDIQWHLIGHLQSNKVKYVAEFVDTIESVDSEKLLEEINKQAAKHNRKIKVLLQVKIAEEDSKTGMEVSETKELFLKYLQGHFENIEITGLMGIGTFTDDTEQTKREFFIPEKAFLISFLYRKTGNTIYGDERRLSTGY